MSGIPNQSAGQTSVFSSTNPAFFSWSFDAKQLTVRNRSAANVYVNFVSTAASTADFELASSGELNISNAAMLSRLALHTVSTSTAAAANIVNYLAIGD